MGDQMMRDEEFVEDNNPMIIAGGINVEEFFRAPRDPFNDPVDDIIRNLFALPPMPHWLLEEQHQQPAPVVQPPPVIVVPRKYPIGSGFPIISTCEFDQQFHVPQVVEASWQNLHWNVRWTTHKSTSNILYGRAIVSFAGLDNLVYKINVTHEVEPSPAKFTNHPDNVVYVDREHNEIKFDETMCAAVESGADGHIVSPKLVLKLTIHNIEVVNEFALMNAVWPGSTKWIIYPDLFTIKMPESTLRLYNNCLDKVLEDMKSKTMSVKEARKFLGFAGALLQGWYQGSDKFHEALMDGYKLGFTLNWDLYDMCDTTFNFETRTMLPMYQALRNDRPYNKSNRDGPFEGICQHFHLKLNPQKKFMMHQIEQMKPIKGHKGQLTFYLEQSEYATLLVLGINLQPISAQRAKLKVDFFERGEVVTHETTYHIVCPKQRTIKTIICLLTDEQIQTLIAGELSVNVQLHMHPTKNNFIRNHVDPEDKSSDYRMPGPITGWLKCSDDKRIGICKEHVAKNSEYLKELFFNTTFKDCCKDEVQLDECSKIVLDALHIIYNRCHLVQVARVERVLALGGFLLAPIIHRYLDMAVLQTDYFSVQKKIDLAIQFDLSTTKYIMRHPEYTDEDAFELSEQQLATLVENKTSTEIDCGVDGRPN